MLYLETIDDIYTNLYNSSITFINNEWELLNATFDIYIVSGETKNYTLMFYDQEDDRILISVISPSDLFVYASSTKQENQK